MRAAPFARADEDGPVEPLVRTGRGLEARRHAAVGLVGRHRLAGLVTGLFLNARHSDRHGERRLHTAAGALLAGLALGVAVLLSANTLILALLVIAGFGLGATQGVFWALPASLGIGAGQVPVGVIAVVSMAGTAGGVVGPFMLGRLRDLSGSHQAGILVLAGFLLAGAALLALWRPGSTSQSETSHG